MRWVSGALAAVQLVVVAWMWREISSVFTVFVAIRNRQRVSTS